MPSEAKLASTPDSPPPLNLALWPPDNVAIRAFGTDKRTRTANKANRADLTTLRRGKRSDTAVCFQVVLLIFAFTERKKEIRYDDFKS